MGKMRGMISRFERNYAVVEFGECMQDIQRSVLPKEAKLGDVIYFDGS